MSRLSITERLVRLCDTLKSDRQQPIAKIRSQANANDSAVRKREAFVGIARTDRRVRRTRDLLRRALLSLVQEQGYERITVQDILDRADVGRSTFYAHYRDKDDLLLSGFEDIRAALATEREEAEHGAGAKRELLQPLLIVFRHVEAHRRFWQPLARKGGAEVVVRILRDYVADLVREHFRAQFPAVAKNQVQLEAAVQFVVGAFIGQGIWWLDNQIPYSAEEMYSIFRRLTTRGVRSFLTTT
jgi:AcrR family transcriptional regulator